jgi:PAS domain S-box-containing protein
MVHRDPSSPTGMPMILRYGIAVLSVAVAIGLDFFLLRQFEAILTPFLFAVGATVWYAGSGPGVLAIVLSVLSLNYFFLPPFFSFSPISYADLAYLTFCTFCALAVGWVSAVLRRAEQELRQAREELDAKVLERTANLQRGEGYLAEAQKLTHTGSWAWDPRTGKVLYCSEEMFRIFGLDPRESLPSRENFRQQIHPEDRDWVKKRFEESLRERVDTFAEYRVLLPDGTVRHISASGHPVLNEDGELIEFVGTAADVTERKRAEVAGQRLAAIVDFSEDAIVSKDLNGIIESWNGGAERLFGYQASEVIGKSILIIIPPDRYDEELGILECIRRGERIKSYETVRMRADGSALDVSLTVSPLRDAAGRIIGASKIARDITERKRAEEALRDMQMKLAHANRVATMGQLSASITHEVKQPIAAARNNARAAVNFMDQNPPDLGEVREALGCVVGDADRAGDIIDRIRDHIKKAPPRKECLDINAGIREVIELTRGETEKNGIAMQANLADGLPLIEGDRIQLQQVILNLIVNAVEAMSGASDGTRELLVSSRKANPGGVLVEVRDSGPGLAPETLDHVFEAFYTTKPGGMGIGLSICRSIIESHGGRMWASANLPGGASFQFALPAIENTASWC